MNQDKSTDALEKKFNAFVKDQVKRSSQGINYSITVEDGAFEKILDTIKMLLTIFDGLRDGHLLHAHREYFTFLRMHQGYS